MRRLSIKAAATALGLSLCVWAQAGSNATGSIENATHIIHYSVFGSRFLQPDIARALKIRRAGNRAIINISARAKSAAAQGEASTAKVSGGYRDLLKYHSLEFREVRETEAVYYLAEFPFTHLETLRFAIEVAPAGAKSRESAFSASISRGAMKSQLVLASGNAGKLAEFDEALRTLGVRVRPQSDFGISSVDEIADSFEGNARLKAEHASKISGLPAIGDDSGLLVEALDGAPGLRSARFAGDDADTENNNRLLLEKLARRRSPSTTRALLLRAGLR